MNPMNGEAAQPSPAPTTYSANEARQKSVEVAQRKRAERVARAPERAAPIMAKIYSQIRSSASLGEFESSYWATFNCYEYVETAEEITRQLTNAGYKVEPFMPDQFGAGLSIRVSW